MDPEALEAWIALYAAVSLLAAFCAIGATVLTTCELAVGAWRPSVSSRLQLVMALPKIWLRWQIHYLRGFPAIAGIALYFAWHLGFDVLAAV